jgi:hypothetical protein
LVSFYFFSLILHPFLQFNCVFFHHGCLSLSKLTFRFIFVGFKRLILIKILKFFVFNLILELLNSHSFLLADVFCLISSIFVHLFDFSLKVLDFWLDLVSVRLLDKDNLAVLNLSQVLVFLLAVLLSDWKHTDWKHTEIIPSSSLIFWVGRKGLLSMKVKCLEMRRFTPNQCSDLAFHISQRF